MPKKQPLALAAGKVPHPRGLMYLIYGLSVNNIGKLHKSSSSSQYSDWGKLLCYNLLAPSEPLASKAHVKLKADSPLSF